MNKSVESVIKDVKDQLGPQHQNVVLRKKHAHVLVAEIERLVGHIRSHHDDKTDPENYEDPYEIDRYLWSQVEG